MISFASDYITGTHPKILERLSKINLDANVGYGCDVYCQAASEKIKKECQCPDAQVYFLTGGTQTNLIVIDSLLSKYQGVISANTGHINAHEAGAIEGSGHKVLSLPNHNGKLDSTELKNYIDTFYSDGNYEHMVFPGLVYISFPTEYGTLYSLSELQSLSEVCHSYNIPLFIDGARLGYGLQSLSSDLTLPDIAKLCDVFYIGGTKVGALMGEAVVFTKKNMPPHFKTLVKQHGGLLAKGWLLGIQFDTLFTDGLYYEISKHAILMAEKLKNLFKKFGYTFYLETPTNQQFIILENSKMAELSKNVTFSFWEKYDETHTVVRFATCWSTTDEQIALLEKYL